MVLPVNGSTHLIPAYYSIINPERMKGWVGLVGRRVVDGLPTLVVTLQLQAERRTGKVCQSETDVLPLCHATNRVEHYVNLIHCRMTNYELLRWLVEMASRDVHHYWMMNLSRSTVHHCSVARSTVTMWHCNDAWSHDHASLQVSLTD